MRCFTVLTLCFSILTGSGCTSAPPPPPSPSPAGEDARNATDPLASADPLLPSPVPARARVPKSPRGSWVVRHEIRDPEGVARVVREASEAGLDRLVVQVRGRGEAYYRSDREPRADGVAPGFDPLGALITAAKAEGIAVHAWVNLLLVASGEALPTDPRHIVRRAPHWLDRNAAEAEWAEGGDHSERLLSKALADPNREGLYLSPALVEVRSDLISMVLELVTRYPLDGIHWDYIRYSGPEAGAHPRALSDFGGNRGLRAGLDRRRREPLSWREFRAQAIDQLVAELSGAVRRARPGLVISAAVRADPEIAARDYGQRWTEWLKKGWIDVACPMNYADRRAEFDRITRASLSAGRIWMGIGAYRLEPEDIFSRLTWIEGERLAEAVLFFSHERLRERPELKDLLAGSPRAGAPTP